jgi:hypothetical protein
MRGLKLGYWTFDLFSTLFPEGQGYCRAGALRPPVVHSLSTVFPQDVVDDKIYFLNMLCFLP